MADYTFTWEPHASQAAQLLSAEDYKECRDNFYLSPAWLDFADTDQLAQGLYGSSPHCAGLVVHSSPQENNPYYSPGIIFGGRRGYHSSVPPVPDLRAAMGSALENLGACDTDAMAWTWPYLSAPDAQKVAAAWEGAKVFFAGAECFIPCEVESFDDFINQLPTSQRRTNFRRELRSLAESDFRACELDGRECLAQVERLGWLLSQVQTRYGHNHSPEAMAAMLSRQLEALGSFARAFCLRDPSGQISAFNLSYEYEGALWTRVVGFDYERTRGFPAYTAVAFRAPVQACCDLGLGRLELGMESFHAKVLRGAQVRPLYSVGFESQPRTVDPATITAGLPQREAQEFERSIAEYHQWGCK
ncbi:MAG: GNAT family N-acetyltransferase [Corynebacterium sp.]|uniref:GNAT family N-acetyltransferase n=1 Tax=Corynebacterium sp. TaxID=1720 RepID=UPI0026DB0A3D|nr:GNAT family N-acetyltransferase [Corynebacterium sp.]MDO4762051.1 GNAT family N-acetyltransferase [Corynebacterium sp.]